jgi:hypothetical protein
MTPLEWAAIGAGSIAGLWAIVSIANAFSVKSYAKESTPLSYNPMQYERHNRGEDGNYAGGKRKRTKRRSKNKLNK